MNQSFIGKLFNFGTIKFFSPVLKQEYFLTNVSNPINLKNAIEDLVDSEKSERSKKIREEIIPIRGGRVEFTGE